MSYFLKKLSEVTASTSSSSLLPVEAENLPNNNNPPLPAPPGHDDNPDTPIITNNTDLPPNLKQFHQLVKMLMEDEDFNHNKKEYDGDLTPLPPTLSDNTNTTTTTSTTAADVQVKVNELMNFFTTTLAATKTSMNNNHNNTSTDVELVSSNNNTTTTLSSEERVEITNMTTPTPIEQISNFFTYLPPLSSFTTTTTSSSSTGLMANANPSTTGTADENSNNSSSSSSSKNAFFDMLDRLKQLTTIPSIVIDNQTNIDLFFQFDLQIFTLVPNASKSFPYHPAKIIYCKQNKEYSSKTWMCLHRVGNYSFQKLGYSHVINVFYQNTSITITPAPSTSSASNNNNNSSGIAITEAISISNSTTASSNTIISKDIQPSSSSSSSTSTTTNTSAADSSSSSSSSAAVSNNSSTKIFTIDLRAFSSHFHSMMQTNVTELSNDEDSLWWNSLPLHYQCAFYANEVYEYHPTMDEQTLQPHRSLYFREIQVEALKLSRWAIWKESISATKTRFYLAFRGTELSKYNIHDALIDLANFPFFITFGRKRLGVLTGFHTMIQNEFEEVIEALEVLGWTHHQKEDNMENDDELVITGHSLGGGLAQVFMLRYLLTYGFPPTSTSTSTSSNEKLMNAVFCITFAAPNCFILPQTQFDATISSSSRFQKKTTEELAAKDEQLTLLLDQLTNHIVNYIYMFDPIAYMPKMLVSQSFIQSFIDEIKQRVLPAKVMEFYNTLKNMGILEKVEIYDGMVRDVVANNSKFCTHYQTLGKMIQILVMDSNSEEELVVVASEKKEERDGGMGTTGGELVKESEGERRKVPAIAFDKIYEHSRRFQRNLHHDFNQHMETLLAETPTSQQSSSSSTPEATPATTTATSSSIPVTTTTSLPTTPWYSYVEIEDHKLDPQCAYLFALQSILMTTAPNTRKNK